MGVQRIVVGYGIAVTLLAIAAFAAPAIAPAAYLATALSYVVFARRRIPLLPAEGRAPWIAMAFGIGSLLLSGIVRGVHASISGEANPFPSPADVLGYMGYMGVIACLFFFVRSQAHRHRRWRVEASIDGFIVAAAGAVAIFASILSTYLSDASVPFLERATNVGYSLLTVVLLGVVATVAVGSGIQNQSWRLLAIGVSLIAASDIFLLLQTAGSDWAGRPAGMTSVLALGSGTAALIHPDAPSMSLASAAKKPSLSIGRLAMLATALLIVPMTLLLSLVVGHEPDLPIVVLGAVILAALSLYRIWLLFAANERVAIHEAELRESTAALVAATTVREALEIAERSASVVVGDTGTASTQPGDGAPTMRIGSGAEAIFIHSDQTLDDSQTIALRGLDAQLNAAVRGIAIREVELQNRLAHQITALVEQSADLVMVTQDRVVSFVTPNAERVLGARSHDVVGRDYAALIHAEDRAGIRQLLDGASSSDTNSQIAEARILCAGEEFRWFDVTARDFTDDPEVAGVVLTARDVTEERAAKVGLRRSEQWFRGLVQHSSDVIAVLDEAGVFTYASPAADDLFGLSPSQLRGRSFIELLQRDDRESIDGVRRAIRSQPRGLRNLEIVIARPDGSRRTAEATITDLRDDPSVSGLVLNVRDVTDRKKLEDDLRHQVLHDDLTGLGSRVQFQNQLADALGPGRRAGSMVAALFIDIDEFKAINDSLGHAAGDQVLVEVSSRLQTRLRLHDRAARFGGDEFAVVLTDVYGEGDVTGIATRILEELSVPVTLHGQDVRLGVSIGIAIDDDGTTSPDDLIRAADVAMYEAKEQGKGRWALFESAMADQTLERFELGNSLGQAIENDELMVYYQPIVDLGCGRTVGVEALVRWNHPARGMVSPGQFIPIAEKNGLIVPLGRWVLDRAVRQVARWRSDGHDIYASVNISAVQLQREGIVTEVLEIVDAAGMDRHAVVLELTESALINDFDLVNQRIEALRQAGLRVAIDDFGTGYASLTYADQFAADILKIDQSFVAKLEDSDESAIVSTVLSIADAMGAQTVAEGIEVPDQHRRLVALGCSLGQGYYFTRPAPALAITETLTRELEGEALIGHGH